MENVPSLLNLLFVVQNLYRFCWIFGDFSCYIEAAGYIQLLKYMHICICSFVSIKVIFSFYQINIPLHDSSFSSDTYMTFFCKVYEWGIVWYLSLSLFSLTIAYEGENGYLYPEGMPQQSCLYFLRSAWHNSPNHYLSLPLPEEVVHRGERILL